MSGAAPSPKLEVEPSPPPEGRGAYSRGLTQRAIVASAREAPQTPQEVTLDPVAFVSSIHRNLQTPNGKVQALQSTLRDEYSKVIEALNEMTQATVTTVEMHSPHVPFEITELGEFDGSSTGLPKFMANLRYLFETCHNDTVANHLIKAIPRALKGPARLWYAAQSDAFKESELGDLDGWEKQLCQAFPQDQQQLQTAATARTWGQTETITNYTGDKMTQMEEAFPSIAEEELVAAVIAGLPARFALLVKKEDGSWPMRSELLEVLQRQEARWRRAGA